MIFKFFSFSPFQRRCNFKTCHCLSTIQQWQFCPFINSNCACISWNVYTQFEAFKYLNACQQRSQGMKGLKLSIKTFRIKILDPWQPMQKVAKPLKQGNLFRHKSILAYVCKYRSSVWTWIVHIRKYKSDEKLVLTAFIRHNNHIRWRSYPFRIKYLNRDEILCIRIQIVYFMTLYKNRKWRDEMIVNNDERRVNVKTTSWKSQFFCFPLAISWEDLEDFCFMRF